MISRRERINYPLDDWHPYFTWLPKRVYRGTSLVDYNEQHPITGRCLYRLSRKDARS